MPSQNLKISFKIFCLLIFFAAIALPQQSQATRPECRDRGTGWDCVDTNTREGGATGCVTGLCPGAANIQCCPPASSTTAEGESEARAGLEEAAGETGIRKFDIAIKIGDIISRILSFVGVIFLILMITGGLIWMTAAGNEERVGKAKKLITSAVIGLIIVFSAYAITYFVTETLLGG